MLRIEESKQLNFHSQLYHNIPEKHILKTIDSAISFDYINERLADGYCKDFGRPAKEPKLMMKLLTIQKLYGLSDEQLIGETKVNLAYMWFIGINPGDELPHPSLLSKFRTIRLKDTELDDIIVETVRQCVEKGIIPEENGASIDVTHILANTTKKVPERVMKQLAKKIFKATGKTDYEIPDYTQIEDHNEAKRVMKEYLEGVIEESGGQAEEEVALAREVLDSPLFIEQKGIRSLADMDARVGYKSKTESFFGYKMEYALTTEGRLITAVGVHDGAYVDGVDFDRLYELSKKVGIDIESIYGDKAYFRKTILDKLKEDGVNAYIPVSASSYKINEELYSYCKDSDQWVCVRGNRTVSKKLITSQRTDRGEYKTYEYVFAKEECEGCPLRDECIKKARTKAKKLGVSTNTAEYYEHSQWTKTEAFKEGYKKRAAIEWKNAELKRFHGLARATGYGLRSVSTQAKLTAIVVNLKRIAGMVSATKPDTRQVGAIGVQKWAGYLGCFHFFCYFLA